MFRAATGTACLCLAGAAEDKCSGVNKTSCNEVPHCTWCDVYGSVECLPLEGAYRYNHHVTTCDKIDNHCAMPDQTEDLCFRKQGCEWCESDEGYGPWDCFSAQQSKQLQARGKKCKRPNVDGVETQVASATYRCPGGNESSCNADSHCTWCDVYGNIECLPVEEAYRYNHHVTTCDKIDNHCAMPDQTKDLCFSKQGCEWCESDEGYGPWDCFSGQQSKQLEARGKKCQRAREENLATPVPSTAYHCPGGNKSSCNDDSRCTWCNVYGSIECLPLDEAYRYNHHVTTCDKIDNHCAMPDQTEDLCFSKQGCEWCESDEGYGSWDCFSTQQSKQLETRGKTCKNTAANEFEVFV